MKTITKLALAAFCISLVSACEDPEPWPNARRFRAAVDEIVYEAPENASESIAAAWYPMSMVQTSEHTVLYVARGSRKLVELDLDTGVQQEMFDLSPYEKARNASLYYSSMWGMHLLRADGDWYILASPGRPLLWINLDSGQILEMGTINPVEARIPESGVSMENVDFSLFSGIQRTNGGFYIAFGQQIFRVAWNGQSPSALMNAPLELIAGSLDSQDSQTSVARDVRLELHDYVFMAENDGWLYFWDGRRLRAVRNDRILTVTGDGAYSPQESLSDFYAQALPESPYIAAHRGKLYTPYWENRNALIEVQVDDLDETTQTVSGRLRAIYPSAGSMFYLIPFEDGFLSLDMGAGSFWKIYGDTLDSAQLVWGPESAEERTYSQNSDANSPYNPNAILFPLSIQMLDRGKAALVYSPTLYRLNYLDLDTGRTVTLREGSQNAMVTDNAGQAWIADGRSLYFLVFNEDGKIDFSYVTFFFNPAEVLGLPCNSDILRLPDVPEIEVSANRLLMFSKNADRIMAHDPASDQVTAIHDSGWSLPSRMTFDIYLSGLMPSYIKEWQANDVFEAILLEEKGKQYLALANMTKSSAEFGTIEIAPQNIHVLAGMGTQEISDGLEVSQTSLTGITSVALSSSNHIVVATEDELFEITQDMRWHSLSEICPSGQIAGMKDLRISGDGESLVVIGTIDGTVHACSQTSRSINGRDIGHSWTSLDADRMAFCSNYIVYQQGNRICSQALVGGSAHCGTMPKGIEPHELACSAQSIFVSGKKDDSPGVFSAPLLHPEKLKLLLGMGAGMPDEIEIQNAQLGSVLGGMATDGLPYLYFWMKDTCTIWKIPAFADKPIEAETRVSRVVTHDLLCDADAFAVQYDGTIAVARERRLYRVDGDEPEYLTEFPDDVLDMTDIGDGFVIMTAGGLYLWEKDWLVQKSVSPAFIENKTIHYAVPAPVSPRMVQSPDENAVLIPVFGGSRILKISL